MPDLYFADMVRETSTSTGPGAFVLDGATPGHRRFTDAVPPATRFHYAIAGITHEAQWEVGEGEISGGALSRLTVLAASGGPGGTDFSEGLKTVTLTVAAQWFAARDDVPGHGHAIADVSGLAAALDGKQPAGSYATAAHGHAIADVSGLAAALDGKQAAGSYAAAAHTHDYLPRDGDGNWIAQSGKFGVGVTTPLAKVEMRGGDFAGFNQHPVTSELSPAGAQLYLGDMNYAHPAFWNSAPGVGAVCDPTGVTGALGIFSFGGVSGQRTLIAVAGHHGYASQALAPGSDNLVLLGRASQRWSVIHAVGGVINTSDEREKLWRGSMSDPEYRAALDIAATLGFFQWTASVTEKGADAARLHFGPKAQQAFAIMESHGLDWRRYGWCCHDEWNDADGTHDRYGIRADQLALFLIAALAQQIAANGSGLPNAAG